ncbi:MAG: hypothetical protein L0Y35_01465 [Flammeovirgaceae bacterium]|nr:hypothetical protein [Flammeovirgaceae bacterium]
MEEGQGVCRLGRATIISILCFFSASYTLAQNEGSDTLQIADWVTKSCLTSNFAFRDSFLILAINKSEQIHRIDYQVRLYQLLSFFKQQRNEFREAVKFGREAVNLALTQPELKKQVIVRDAITNLTLCYSYFENFDSTYYWTNFGKRLAKRYHDNFNYSLLLSLQALTDTRLKREGVDALYDSAIFFAKHTPSLHDDVMAAFNKVSYMQEQSANAWGASLELLTSFEGDIDNPDFKVTPRKPYERNSFTYRDPKSTLYALLGITYIQLLDVDNACYYHQKIYNTYKKQNNLFLPYVMCDLAEYESFRANDKRAIQLFDSARVLIKQTTGKDSFDYASFYYMRGWIAEQNQKYQEAIRSYKRASQVAEVYLPKVSIISLYRVYSITKDLRRADSLNHEIQKSLSPKDVFLSVLFRKELADHYSRIGNTEEALNHYLRYYSLKDSLTSVSRYHVVKQVETKFKTKEKERELTFTKKEKELQSLELQQERAQTLYLTGGLVILTILSVALYKNFNTKRKQALTLADRNNRIELLIRELHHRVKNNMQTISSLLSLQSIRITDENAKAALLEGQTRVDAMSLIHQKLYLDDDLRSVDMEQYLKALVNTLAQSYGYDPAVVKSEISLAEKNLDVDVAIPLGLIINELIINAFKYAFETVEEPELQVILKRTDEKKLALVIRDNGKGLPDKLLGKTKNGSFGLKLVHTLSRQLNASLSTYNDGGAVFEFVVNS